MIDKIFEKGLEEIIQSNSWDKMTSARSFCEGYLKKLGIFLFFMPRDSRKIEDNLSCNRVPGFEENFPFVKVFDIQFRLDNNLFNPPVQFERYADTDLARLLHERYSLAFNDFLLKNNYIIKLNDNIIEIPTNIEFIVG